jgi:mono/diheme cytochrome c family protein
MTRPLLLVLLVLSLASFSCGGGATASACPTGGTALTYANFGQSFMSTHCISCHGAGRAEKGVSLASQALVQSHATAVESTVASGAMPPSGASPTAAERAQLAEWLACGAP